jgi:magnesium transporter
MPPSPLAESLTSWNSTHSLDDSSNPSTSKSFIGILVAIGGNILISLALNCQKLAHWRLEREHRAVHSRHESKSKSSLSDEEAIVDGSTLNVNEIAPLLNESIQGRQTTYGCENSQKGAPASFQVKSKPLLPRLSSSQSSSGHHNGAASSIEDQPIPIATAEVVVDGSNGLPSNPPVSHQEDGGSGAVDNEVEGEATEREEGDYLKSKLW